MRIYVTDLNLKRLKILIFEIILFSLLISNNFQYLNKYNHTAESKDRIILKEADKDSRKPPDTFIETKKTLDFITNKSFLNYKLESNQNIGVNSKRQIDLFSSKLSQLRIDSSISNITYELESSVNNDSQDWIRSEVSGDGDVEVSKLSMENKTFYRLNFTDNEDAVIYGKSNKQFNVSSLPAIDNQSTFISFSYRIPFLSPELNSSVYRVELEFKFINRSIIFVLAESGWNYGSENEENIINGSNAIYILCGQEFPYNWLNVSYNLTRLIHTYFPSTNSSYFSEIQMVYCNILSIYSGYTLLLDFETINLITKLPPKIPLIYTIGNESYFVDDGSADLITTIGNTTLLIQENSPWTDYLKTSVNLNITREINLSAPISINNWNSTYIEVISHLDLPKLLEDYDKRYIFIKIPSDWLEPKLINASSLIERIISIAKINEYLTLDLCLFNAQNLSIIQFEALVKNYITVVNHPYDVSYNEILKVKGILEHPLTEDITLVLRNYNFTFSTKTVSFVNSSFSFPDIYISDVFPNGLFNLSITWSNSYEFGLYQSNVIIHENSPDEDTVKIYTSKSLSLYRFESLTLDVGLFKGNTPFVSNDTLVLLVKGNEMISFINTVQNNFSLHMSSITWSPGNYTLEIIALKGADFYANVSIEVSVSESSLSWSFANIQTQIEYEQNITFDLFCYLLPTNSETYFPAKELEIQIWVNNSLKKIYQTNEYGFVEINLFPNISIDQKHFSMMISAFANNILVKMQTLEFYVNNVNSDTNFTKVDLREISKTLITPNSSFYLYYNVIYPIESSRWYVPISTIAEEIISAYIIKDNYIIPTEFIDGKITWVLNSNNTSLDDILVIELPSPTIYVSPSVKSNNFNIEIEIVSPITITNFSLQIDLNFLNLPIYNLSLYDSLNRDITRFYSIEMKGNCVNISGMTVVSDISIVFLFSGLLTDFDIEIKTPFKQFYEYNESITGSWVITPFFYSNYSVIYSIENTDFIVKNTTKTGFLNGSVLITATLPPQNWNDKISVQLCINISDHFLKKSDLQEFVIIDSYAPEVDFSIQYSDSFFSIDIFSFEPKYAAGLKNISLLQDSVMLNSSNSVKFHSRLLVPLDILEKKPLFLIVFDNAGNNFTSIIELNILNANSELFNNKILAPIIYSLIFSGSVIIVKYYRKQKNAIL
ncbi:MAG: hypothetical protein ACTSPG_01310 [Candidatus Hodarchaeales archaeon]